MSTIQVSIAVHQPFFDSVIFIEAQVYARKLHEACQIPKTVFEMPLEKGNESAEP